MFLKSLRNNQVEESLVRRVKAADISSSIVHEKSRLKEGEGQEIKAKDNQEVERKGRTRLSKAL